MVFWVFFTALALVATVCVLAGATVPVSGTWLRVWLWLWAGVTLSWAAVVVVTLVVPHPPSICRRRSLFSDRLSHTGTATPVFPPDDVVTPRRVPPGFLGPFRLPTRRLPLSDLRAVAGGVPLGPGCRRSVRRAITE